MLCMTDRMGSSVRSGLLSILISVVLQAMLTNGREYLYRECGETIDMGNTGDTMDSQMGFDYVNDLNCTVTLRTTDNRRIMLTFDQFDVQGETPCSTDYLDVFEGSSRLGRLCGSVLPGEITSTSNEITVTFKTDSSVTRRGFLIVYTSFTMGFCDSDEFACDNGRCVDESFRHDLYDNCGDNSDETSNDGIDIDFDDAISSATGLLQWGIGVLVAIIIGIIAAIVLTCVGCGCLCYHCCCKTRRTQQTNTVVLTTAMQQPGTNEYSQPGAPPPAYNQQPL